MSTTDKEIRGAAGVGHAVRCAMAAGLRGWVARSVVVALAAAAALAAQTGTAQPATAAVTPVSTFTKSATDLTNGNGAVAGGPAGTAQPGDQIQWVLGYGNNTGRDVTVNVTDPITAGQSYVAGSLQTPPNLTGSVAGGIVSASGSVLTGTTSARSPAFTTANVNFTTPGGDGWSVEGFGGNVYTVFHDTLTPPRCSVRR